MPDASATAKAALATVIIALFRGTPVLHQSHMRMTLCLAAKYQFQGGEETMLLVSDPNRPKISVK